MKITDYANMTEELEKEESFRETEVALIPEDWKVIKFEEAISKKRFKVGKIKKREYNKVGKYPVIDQSQTFIAGFTDESKKIYQGDLPIIIFGDHTRIFKFIDFPFVIGADGVKVILPEKALVNPLFFYYVLSNLKIESRGYNRHYPLLREKIIPIPPLPEQQKIAKVLSAIQRVIEQQDKIIKAAKNLKKSLMQKFFTEGLGNTRFKETEIGTIPENWETKRILDVCKVVTGGTPSTKHPEYFGGNIKWLKSGEIEGLYIYDTKERITQLGLENSNAKIYPAGSVAIALSGRGQTRGRTAILKEPMACSQSVAFIIPNSELIAEFLHYNLSHRYLEIRNLTGHYDRSGLNLSIVSNIKIPIPPLPEQQEITCILTALDKKIELEERKMATLKELFKTMLHTLMTGELRLKDIEV